MTTYVRFVKIGSSNNVVIHHVARRAFSRRCNHLRQLVSDGIQRVFHPESADTRIPIAYADAEHVAQRLLDRRRPLHDQANLTQPQPLILDPLPLAIARSKRHR